MLEQVWQSGMGGNKIAPSELKRYKNGVDCIIDDSSTMCHVLRVHRQRAPICPAT